MYHRSIKVGGMREQNHWDINSRMYSGLTPRVNVDTHGVSL